MLTFNICSIIIYNFYIVLFVILLTLYFTGYFYVTTTCDKTKELLDEADYIGSTAGIIQYVAQDDAREYIIGTEIGVFYELNIHNFLQLLSKNIIKLIISHHF